MIRLKKPLLWEGHIIPAEATISLPAAMEKRIISAKNGEVIVKSEEKTEPESSIDRENLCKEVERLKLDLPDGLTCEQVKEAVEKAEKEQQGSDAEPAVNPEPQAADPELNLGRLGPVR